MMRPGKSSWFGSSTPAVRQGLPQRGARPSEEISPLRHPVKYFTTAMSELPISSKSKGAKSRVVQPTVPRNDPISLSTPTGPPTPELVISLAQLSESQGNVPQARGHFQRALANWPGHVDLLRAAARMEDRQGQLAVAESLYRQAAAANPQHAGALNDLGLCLARQGKLDVSVQVIEQAIQLQPDKPLYRNNVATVLVEMRQDQKALAHLSAVHGSAAANYNLGQLLVQRGRSDEAAGYFVAAIEQQPDMQAAHDALGMLQSVEPAGAPTPTDSPAVATAPASVPEMTAPSAAPANGTQQVAPAGPEFGYPSTARSPDPGASSFVPPNYYSPRTSMPPTAYPRVGSRPQYVPPMSNQPGTMRR
jgi:tetratricopeptide (TPR) repeat protein